MRHDDNLLWINALAGSNDRTGAHVMPTLMTVFGGVKIAGIKAANIALVAKLAKLLLEVIRR
ncbi:hypothetical protein D3C75_703550 [compost metagenome]